MPLGDISDEGMKGAIRARNSVIHRGHQQEADDALPDLWDHMTLAREIVVRFILTLVGFRGRYICHWGGMHDAVFPPAEAA